MRVFITGGTGLIGRPVTAELVAAGHEVVGLVRSEAGAESLAALGAEPHEGDLRDPTSFSGPAGSSDALVHLAFDYGRPIESDREALGALLAATDERAATLVYTSGCWVVGDTGGARLGEEASTEHPAAIVAWRVEQEARVLAAASRGRVTAVVRPGVVYGAGGGSAARMFATAADRGAADFIGDGSNHWSMIHVEDLADLYVAVVEARRTGTYHGVDGTPLLVGRVAGAASRAAGAGGATRSTPLEVAREKIGPIADAMCLDQMLEAPASRSLGWTPRHPSFIDAASRAFEAWRLASR